MELKIKVENYKIVLIDEVRLNTWNPKDKDTEEYKQVLKSIKIKGQREAISVRENDGYEILDGEQRWKACKELGVTHILIYNWGQVSDKDAREETIYKQIQVPFNEIKLADLIKDLTKYPDLKLPYTQEQIDEYCKLTSFDWDQYNTEKPEFEEGVRTISVKCTESQYKLINDAINQLKKKQDCSEGRALELIVADYLAGAKNE